MLRDRIREIINAPDDLGSIRRANLERIKESAIFEENIARVVAVMRQLAGKK
jgi:hypothetical protein